MMSETDDTDVLLLIPPNFFLVQSSGSEDSILESSRTVVHKPTSSTAHVLDKLVTQVHTLESRLDSLEINSDISSFSSLRRPKTWDTTDSIDSRSLDRKCFTFPRRRKRKVVKKKRSYDLSLTSIDTTSTHNQNILPLKLQNIDVYHSKIFSLNDIQSMDGDLSSIVSTPNKKNDKLLLHEIDEFLTKVENYETPDTKFKDFEVPTSPKNVIKATGDYLSQKFDPSNPVEDIKLPSGRIVPSDILDKYIYLVKNNPTTSKSDKIPVNYKSNEEPSTSHLENISKRSIDVTKQETKSPSIRKLDFTDKDVQPTSTPKRQQSNYLDSFRPSSNKIYDRASKVLEQYKAQNSNQNTQASITDNYSSLNKPEFKMPQMRPYCPDNRDAMRLSSVQNKYIESIDTDLLSLSELWGDRGERADRSDSLRLEEERLKREHCESLIQQLQKKILEQQEKLAVAVKVDRAKDAAINKLREAWLRLTGNLDKAEERHRQALENMVREVDNFKLVADNAQKKKSHFEVELYKALDLAHDYQDKCKQYTYEKRELEELMNKSLAERDEIIARKNKEIEVLAENYETVMRLNKQSTDCVKNLEDTLEKEKLDHEHTKCSVTDLTEKIQSLKDEMSLLVQERDLIKNKVHEERSRANVLERQLAEKQNQTSELLRKCDNLDDEVKSLRKLLELQKAELKCHYQKQLEDAVLAKLHEFQQQLNLAEKEMENDARAKENSIIDTYNKQITRIEEQHKLEIDVLEEKQKEEIKLYRLQLAQASERISLLESKVESFRRRRGQIATQLHSVMESQWRQALLILTNGNNASSLDTTRPDSVPTVASEYAAVPPLPVQTRARTHAHAGEYTRTHDKLFDGLSDTELQQYVKLLLTKPATLDGSGDSVTEPQRDTDEPTSDRHGKHDTDKVRRNLAAKPPWKA